jgi:hypothetical protein
MKGLLARRGFSPQRAGWERKGFNAVTSGSGFFAPFVKALENKKSPEITLRLNNNRRLFIVKFTIGIF